MQNNKGYQKFKVDLGVIRINVKITPNSINNETFHPTSTIMNSVSTIREVVIRIEALYNRQVKSLTVGKEAINSSKTLESFDSLDINLNVTFRKLKNKKAK